MNNPIFQAAARLAPTVSDRPDVDTKLTLFGFYQNDPDNFAGWFRARGTVFPSSAGRIRRSFYPGESNFDDYDREQFAVGYNFKRRLNDGWTFRQKFRYTHVDTSFEGAAVNYLLPFGAAAGELNRVGISNKERFDDIALDNQAEYHIGTGPLAMSFSAA